MKDLSETLQVVEVFASSAQGRAVSEAVARTLAVLRTRLEADRR